VGGEDHQIDNGVLDAEHDDQECGERPSRGPRAQRGKSVTDGGVGGWRFECAGGVGISPGHGNNPVLGR